MAGTAPTGTATVVLGDVAGSTRLWQEHPEAMGLASRRLADLLDELAGPLRGHLPREQGEGDNVVATFAAAADAVAFAVALDEALVAEPWPDDLTLTMRIGVHTGDVEWDEAIGYLGPTFNRCARLRDLGRARMILLSQTTRDIVAARLPPGCELRDLGVHQLRDLSRTEQVHQLRHPGSPAAFAPLKSVSVLPNNLPVPVTSLVGREQDIEHVARQFAEHRLVTLTGAGGSGKTRLAQHVASELLPFAPDGAWWVDLIPVAEDERVPVVIAASAGVADVVPSRRAAEVAAGGIGDQRMLLVVDNCEHVVDAVADTVELLLRRCPNVRVLATSREALDVDGERAVRVRPLETPSGDAPSLDELRRHPATSLFLDRAALDDAALLDRGQRRAVAEICRRLDGLPLAVELAAARTRVLSLDAIEAGLDDRFGLLRAGGRRSRRRASRQRTLEASVAWSYDLLEDDEAAMLRRLAVFPAGFGLDGARDVGAADAPADAIDLLSALVEKSLVTVRPSDDGRRYRLLESIRHFALDRLREHDEEAAAREAHLHHTLVHTVSLTPDGYMLGMGPVVALPASLRDDIRTADETATAIGRPDLVVELYWSLFSTLVFDTAYHAALTSLRGLLEDEQRLDAGHRARAYAMVMAFLAAGQRFDAVVDLADRALAAGREDEAAGDGEPLAPILSSLAVSCGYAGRPGGAAYARECLARTRAMGARLGRPAPIATMGPHCFFGLGAEGHDVEAFTVADEVLAAADASGLDHFGAFAAILRVPHAHRVERPADELLALLEDAERRIPDDVPRLRTLLAAGGGIWVGFFSGREDVRRHHLEQGLANAGPPGSGSHAMMAGGRVIEAYAAGDTQELIERSAAAAAALDGTGQRYWAAFVPVILAMGLVRADHPDAGAAIETARTRMVPGTWVNTTGWLQGTEARHLVARGRPGEALDRVAAMAATELRTEARMLWMGLVPAAAALLALDRPRDAAIALGAAVAHREATGWVDVHAGLTAATTEAVRGVLGPDAFGEAVTVGRTRERDDLRRWLVGLRDAGGA